MEDIGYTTTLEGGDKGVDVGRRRGKRDGGVTEGGRAGKG